MVAANSFMAFSLSAAALALASAASRSLRAFSSAASRSSFVCAQKVCVSKYVCMNESMLQFCERIEAQHIAQMLLRPLLHRGRSPRSPCTKASSTNLRAAALQLHQHQTAG